MLNVVWIPDLQGHDVFICCEEPYSLFDVAFEVYVLVKHVQFHVLRFFSFKEGQFLRELRFRLGYFGLAVQLGEVAAFVDLLPPAVLEL